MSVASGLLGMLVATNTLAREATSAASNGAGQGNPDASEPAPTSTADGSAPTSASTPEPDFTPDSPEEEASRYFKRGVELFDAGQLQEALVQFLRSNEKASSVAALRNAALCLAKLGRADEARAKLDQAIAHPKATPAEVSEMTAESLRLEASLGTLALTVDVDGARVVVDGRSLGFTPLHDAVRLAAGSHLVRVEKPGYVPHEAPVSVAAGQDRTLAVELQARPHPAHPAADGVSVVPLTLDSKPQPLEPAAEPNRSLRTWSWVGVGTGATLLAVATGAYFERKRDLDHLQRSCEAMGSGEYDCTNADPDDLHDLKRRSDRLGTLGTVMVTSGGLGVTALLLGSVGLWHTAGQSDNGEPSARLGLWVAGTRAGLSGRF